MTSNIAELIPRFLEEYAGKNVAALLRPCEVRTLKIIQQNLRINLDQLCVFSTDCFGCYTPNEFNWRMDRIGSSELLADETLHFSHLGGIVSYRYRVACQLCSQPAATEGDVNILVGGLPIQEHILIGTTIEFSEKLSLFNSPMLPRDHPLVSKNQDVMNSVQLRNQETKSRLALSLAYESPPSLDDLVDQINDCNDCRACIDICPICSSLELDSRPSQILDKDTILKWMVSCVGCGLCEDTCAEHRPMAAIFNILRDQLESLTT
jgi:formate dehydrogenase subunit beta